MYYCPLLFKHYLIALYMHSIVGCFNVHSQHMEAFCVLEHAKRVPQCKVIVWTGTGRAFSSGM